MKEIDVKIRAIYHLMLNPEIFITVNMDTIRNGVGDSNHFGRRVVCCDDRAVTKTIINCGTEDMSALTIAKRLAASL